MRQRIAYVDLLNYDAQSGKFYGDMGYAICDENETRVPIEDMETLKFNVGCYIDGDEVVENGETTNDRGGFSVFIVRSVDVEVEEGESICYGDRVFDTDKVEEVYVCATECVARVVVEERFGNDVPIHYRDSDDIFG
jgi:hypothetical protein